MTFFLAQTVNGLVYGMTLFLIAAGLSLIFGLMNVVNVAHGSFFMLGAFLGFGVQEATGSFWAALLLAPLPVIAAGVVMERLFIRRLYERPHLDQVLLTFGFTFVFLDAVKFFWDSDIHSIAPPDILEGVVRIGGVVLARYRLFLVAFGLALALLLWLSIDRTRIGAMVRASVDDSVTAEGLGINVLLLRSCVFALGAGLSAIGGVVAGPIVGVYAGMDIEVLVPAFVVVVVGGMGSLRGAFLGSILVGLADTFGKVYLPGASLFLIYLLMIAVLLVRPSGLFSLKQSTP